MTNTLSVKEVTFNGDTLKVAQDTITKTIYIGVSWVCNGLGFTKSQKDTQIQNVQSDIVLNKGCLKFQAGVFDQNNSTVALTIDYLPLWLAKISITPAMKKSNPELVEKLIQYQLKAKDVLAQAFILNKQQLMIPQSYKEAIQHLLSSIEKNEQLEQQNQTLLPKAQGYDTVINSKGTLSMSEFAKSVKWKYGIKYGSKNLYKLLRDKSYIQQNGREPYGQYVNAGYFIAVEYPTKNGEISISTRITPKGVDYLLKKFRGWGLLEDSRELVTV